MKKKFITLLIASTLLSSLSAIAAPQAFTAHLYIGALNNLQGNFRGSITSENITIYTGTINNAGSHGHAGFYTLSKNAQYGVINDDNKYFKLITDGSCQIALGGIFIQTNASYWVNNGKIHQTKHVAIALAAATAPSIYTAYCSISN